MTGSGTNRTIPLSSSCPLRTQSTYRMTMSVVHCSRSSPRVTRSSSFKMQSTNLNRSKPPSLFICSLTKTAAPVTKLVGRQRTTVVSRLRCARRYQIIASSDRRCGDVQYSLDDRSAFWLDSYRASGRAVDAQAWRKILNGSVDLIALMKVDVFVDHTIGLQRVQAANISSAPLR